MVITSNMLNCITSFKYPTVLIFDSGVGGLSIYQELRSMLPYVCYLYFFDNEGFPYGERSSRFILHRVVRIFTKICQRHRLDLVILACNTVTVLLLEKLRSYFFFPILGIVPDVTLALQCTRNGIVGLLGTYRTINSEFVLNIVNWLSMNYQVLLLSASELVCITEDKILCNKEISISLLREIFIPWLNILKQPDTIILGCTHFLHLEKELRMIFSKNVRLIGIPSRYLYRVVLSLSKNHVNITKYVEECEIRNRAYCSMITEKVLLDWSLVLRKYNFFSLEEISIS